MTKISIFYYINQSILLWTAKTNNFKGTCRVTKKGQILKIWLFSVLKMYRSTKKKLKIKKSKQVLSPPYYAFGLLWSVWWFIRYIFSLVLFGFWLTVWSYEWEVWKSVPREQIWGSGLNVLLRELCGKLVHEFLCLIDLNKQ